MADRWQRHYNWHRYTEHNQFRPGHVPNQNQLYVTDLADADEHSESITFNLESVTIGPDTTAPVVIPAELVNTAGPSEPKLTKNQQTMFSVLYATGGPGANNRGME